MVSRQGLVEVNAEKQAFQHGDPARVEQQHKDGKLTARERAQKLLDKGSFVELDTMVMSCAEGAGVVTGYGTVKDRPVYLFSQDYTVHGGAMGQMHAKKILKVLELARKTGAPVIAMLDSAGVRLEEGASAMSAYADVFATMTRMSGVCPMIALVLGPCVGAAAMLSQICDITIMDKKIGILMSHGPQVMSATLDKEYTIASAGSADFMSTYGAVALSVENEDEAFSLTASLLELLPGCNMEDAPIIDTDDMNRTISVTDVNNVHALISELSDGGTYIELYNTYGNAIVTVMMRLGGRTVGVIATNPNLDDGAITPCAARKAARFIRLMDCYNIPIISLINSVGIKVVEAEQQPEMLRAATQLLYAYAEATSAKISIITGSAIGQAYVAMGGKANSDITYAWPGSIVSALLPEAAVQIINRKDIDESQGDAVEAKKVLAEKYAQEVASGVEAAKKGMIDDVIDPSLTRQFIIASLEMLSSKRDANLPKKHGNLPL